MAAVEKRIEKLFIDQNVVRMRNPRTGEPLYEVVCATPQEIAMSFDKARRAFEVIKTMTLKERLNELNKVKSAIIDNHKEIIDQIVRENGKDKFLAQLEVLGVIDLIETYQNNAERWLAEKTYKAGPMATSKKCSLIFEPAGPTLVIAPWNFPLATPMMGILCAFVAGNSVIVKPSEWTQLSGLFEKIFTGSGFMKDAVQVIYGNKETGRLCIEAKPSRIVFIGSTAVGKKVMSHAGQYLIPVVMECGGKDPMIVCEDADIDRAVKAATFGALLNSGQICASIERLYVHESIHDEFVQKLKKDFESVHDVHSMTHEDRGDLDMGCMTTDFNIRIIEDHVQDAVNKGAKIVIGGKANIEVNEYVPTIVDNTRNDMKINREETFGPLVAVQTFKTDEEAIRLSNDTPYGLSSSVFSENVERAKSIASRLETGSVNINNVLGSVTVAALPWGGAKESGVGRIGGELGLHAMSNVKTIVIDSDHGNEISWFPHSEEKYKLLDEILTSLKKKNFSDILHLIIAGIKLNKLKK